jgi:hypothetical protein
VTEEAIATNNRQDYALASILGVERAEVEFEAKKL